MCNAWNHSAGCTCGWGGVRPPGGEPGAGFWWVPPITKTYKSYVNPNARCPVCSAAVFFYCSPNGGRVFFDELGPPWPKHPCTDSRSIPKKIGIGRVTNIPEAAKEYKWQASGWAPFFFETVSRVDNKSQKVTGILDGEQLTLYINHPLEQHGKPSSITSECMAHVLKTENNKYELSILTTSGDSVYIKAYTSSLEARNGLKVNLAPNPSKPTGARTKYVSKRNDHVNKTGFSGKEKSPGNNIIALAFDDAQKKNKRNT